MYLLALSTKDTLVAAMGQKFAMPGYCTHRAATQNQQLTHKATETLRDDIFLRRSRPSLKLGNFRLQYSQWQSLMIPRPVNFLDWEALGT